MKHPFWQGVIVLFVSYALIEWGIGYILPLIGVASVALSVFALGIAVARRK